MGLDSPMKTPIKRGEQSQNDVGKDEVNSPTNLPFCHFA